MTSNMRQLEPRKQCSGCLNFSNQRSVYKDRIVLWNLVNRSVHLGTCLANDVEVSEWCVCDNWQDDA